MAFYLRALEKPVQHFRYWNRIWIITLMRRNAVPDKLMHWKLIKKLRTVVDNFENSPGLIAICFHAGLDEFVEDPEDEYDLIVSNPPFYSENYYKQKMNNVRFSPFSRSPVFEGSN
jgi:hypothetical protein